jgi:CubicO group peptidase (beta-lactamase class C family)
MYRFAALTVALLGCSGGSATTADGGADVGVDVQADIDAPGETSANACQATGATNATYAAVDAAVFAFMEAQGVHNAELALSESGTTLLSRAYTCPGAIGAPTAASTVFRLASNSKAWTSAALDVVIQHGTISRATTAFDYVGITTPLPSSATVDPRVLSITVGNLIDHMSGWDDTVPPYFDPVHSMRTIALALGLTQAIDQTELVQYMLGQPLQEAPGTTYAYCNFCYVVLGMIVEKASGTAFVDFVNQQVATPIGVTNLVLSPTLEPRLPGEVGRYDSPNMGLSAIDVTSSTQVPAPNGGDGLIREVAAGAGGLATSAESMLKLMDHYLIWGVGPAPPFGADWAREGGDEGTQTWAEQRADEKRWAFLINTRNYTYANAFSDFTTQVDKLLDSLP